MEKDNKKFWDKISKLYTNIIERKNKKTYNEVSKIIKKYLKENYKVLELACGTGQLSFDLYNKVDKYIATDFSEKMISEAQKRDKDNLISFETADATKLKYENNAFDMVIISNALHVMPYPELALQEIKRVLKDDGKLIAPTFVYDGVKNNFIIWLFDKIGFKTYNKWSSNDIKLFIEQNGFLVENTTIIESSVLPECVLIGKLK